MAHEIVGGVMMTTVLKNGKHLAEKLPAVITLLFAAAGQTQAKNIDYTPDVTSDAYWDTHHIGAVRVTAAGKDEQNREYIIYELERQLAGQPLEQARTVLVSHLWFGLNAEEPPLIRVNDRLVLYIAKDEPAPLVAAKLDGALGGSQVLDSLVQIARLRANQGDLQAYMDGVFAGDPILSRYSLRHLLEQKALPAPGNYVLRVRQLRDEESRETKLRVLANRLAERLEGRSEYSDTEYSWLQASLARSKTERWMDLRPFVDRLLEFETKRPESVAFFARLVGSLVSSQAVRIAAYSTFEDARVFRFENPDALSEQITETCIQMLKDRESSIRAAGAALLYNISMRLNPENKSRYMDRSRTAIQNAFEDESDVAIRNQLANYLELISM
jgi:hypothetical protein